MLLLINYSIFEELVLVLGLLSLETCWKVFTVLAPNALLHSLWYVVQMYPRKIILHSIHIRQRIWFY